jgi:hypothetical protein
MRLKVNPMPQLERKEIYYLIRAENIKKVEELPEEVQVDEFQYTLETEMRTDYGEESEKIPVYVCKGKTKIDKKYRIMMINQDINNNSDNVWRPVSFYGDELEFHFEDTWSHHDFTQDIILKLDVLEEVKSNKRKEI